MIISGLKKASKYGFDPKANSIHHILVNIGFGALLMAIGFNLNMIENSLFGTATTGNYKLPDLSSGSSSVTSWQFMSGTSQQFKDSVVAALTFVQLVGAVAFVRGWLVMKKVVEGGGNATTAQGITFIVGGALSMNIGVFLQLMDKTFGTNLM